MKHSVSTLFTALLLSAAILPAAAQSQTTKAVPTSLNLYTTSQPSVTYQPSPFELAYFTYRGGAESI